ncbi:MULTISPECIES: SDR family oxidoreductase [Micromonospora]|nr:SDR family oxidoreductase [Micromonospora antibiotica]
MTARVFLVTGVSRRVGIGAAVARTLAADGHRLLLTGLPDFDDAQPYGGDPDGVPALLADLAGSAEHITADLLDPGTPAALVAEAVRRHGRLDAVVAAHAYSTSTRLGELDATQVDRHLLVNVRACLLLADAFATAFTAGAGGRLVFFSSGQRLGPMPDELAYAASKAALENLTTQLAPLLMARGITVNCLNPGPTDTGYAAPEAHAAVAARFPGGRWGTPQEAARLVRFLCSREADWITGQVIDSEGGFNRYG